MAEPAVIIGVVVLGIILLFGTSYIITAAEKTSPMVSNAWVSIQKDTDSRCDLCLKDFEKEGIRCTHDSKDRICVALSNYYCLTNCSVNLQQSSRAGSK